MKSSCGTCVLLQNPLNKITLYLDLSRPTHKQEGITLSSPPPPLKKQMGHTTAVVRRQWHADDPRSPFCLSALPPDPRTMLGRALAVRVSVILEFFLLPPAHVQHRFSC